MERRGGQREFNRPSRTPIVSGLQRTFPSQSVHSAPTWLGAVLCQRPWGGRRSPWCECMRVRFGQTMGRSLFGNSVRINSPMTIVPSNRIVLTSAPYKPWMANAALSFTRGFPPSLSLPFPCPVQARRPTLRPFQTLIHATLPCYHRVPVSPPSRNLPTS